MRFNKRGFTLAEVLITLGIVGVVAALSTPMLVHNISDAQVFPKLSKFKNSFDNATRRMLAEEDSESIDGIDSVSRANHMNGDRTGVFMNLMQNYMKISDTGEEEWYTTRNTDGSLNGEAWPKWRQCKTEDGMYFRFSIGRLVDHRVAEGFPDIPANQFVGHLHLDINGPKGPNVMSKDVFWFEIYNDGTLRPSGSDTAGRYAEISPQNRTWRNGICDETRVRGPQNCAGSIFDNGRVIYDR